MDGEIATPDLLDDLPEWSAQETYETLLGLGWRGQAAAFLASCIEQHIPVETEDFGDDAERLERLAERSHA